MIKKNIKKANTTAAVVDVEEEVVATAPKAIKKIVKKPLPKAVTKVEEDDLLEEEDDLLEDEAEEIEPEVEDTDEESEDDESEDDESEEESEDDESEDDESEDEESEDEEEETEDDESEDDESEDEESEEESEDEEEETEDDESEDEESEDEEEETEKPKTKVKSKKAKKNKLAEDLSPARALALKSKESGPAKGKRYYNDEYADAENLDTRSANKDTAFAYLVHNLKKAGMGYIFDGCKFQTEEKNLAGVILDAVAQTALDCIYIEGTGMPFMNGKFVKKHVAGKVYPAIKGSNMSCPVFKAEHDTITFSSEYEKHVGAMGKQPNGASELSTDCSTKDNVTFTLKKDAIYGLKKGDNVDINGKRVKASKTAAAPAKKAVKKK
jgi:chemotaxis protein histidine kinase CheA